MAAAMEPATIGIVGTGWRAEFFARIAAALPGEFQLAGVTARSRESAERAASRWRTVAYASPAGLVRSVRPDVTIVCVPWEDNPHVIETVVDAGGHVLAETPPAPGLPGLHRLWERVGSRNRVQVAEQYLSLPGHAARLAAVTRGVIGDVSSVEVSSTHGYHAISLMRGYLRHTGAGPVTVHAQQFEGTLVDPLSRAGWSEDLTPKPAQTILATVDFGDGFGLYDFTDNQWHNQLRFRRILIRGSHGEIQDDDVVRLAGPRQIVRSEFRRYQLGYDLNLDGYDTQHISLNGEVVYTNPFVGCRFMDEEIAMAALLRQTVAWVRQEAAAPYPLARACQDHAVALAIDESLASGEKVTTDRQPWAGAEEAHS